MLRKILLICALSVVAQASERPRGVSSAKASFYQPGKDFKCLMSEEVIAWEFVNDDYCDCKDGSDEPGTSACSNGFFFCENRGHRGTYITSSRVNDGVCDCCDGSDEFDEVIKCSNTCEEIGRKEREEREQFRQLQEQGFKIKLEYVQQGRRTKDEKRSKLSELEKQLPELTAARDALKNKKEEAEAPEKEAKEQHEKEWEEYKEKLQAEKDRVKAIHAFADLDVNSDKTVDYVEMQTHLEFDIDSDGVVSIEEAKEYLDDNEGVNLDTFKEKIWANIKDIYKAPADEMDQSQPTPDQAAAETPQPADAPTPSPVAPPPDRPATEFDEEDDERDYYEEEEEEEDEEEVSDEPPKAKEEEEDGLKMPPYNAETQKLIDAAEAVRNEHNEADNKVRETENAISELKKYLEVDYGRDEEFSILRGQCFEHTDREYTYKLCPFDKTSQKPKAGGMETSLGRWGHWYGPEEDKFDAMKYENGQSCWNGPSRSCHVNLHCGTENKLTGASEPSRCEYQFEFTTPARCQHPEEPPPRHEHVEL